MLNLSMMEQKVIVGGSGYRAEIFDKNGKYIKGGDFPNWMEAESWAQYQAAHNGRTYVLTQI